ncbi:hypothetical protein D9758_010402 [Tetrapyrgos nigripes]|uniref:F-box domain-containing protein n=1 Tax=Tetrapyrgos nigripes TaxID=182062 RepID=A0A8H5FVQ6_9AGAR|nr:hypothetical protein D9758_010402 [Tetrapyrgos nigripes]
MAPETRSGIFRLPEKRGGTVIQVKLRQEPAWRLRELLRGNGLEVGGRWQELFDRLQAFSRNEASWVRDPLVTRTSLRTRRESDTGRKTQNTGNAQPMRKSRKTSSKVSSTSTPKSLGGHLHPRLTLTDLPVELITLVLEESEKDDVLSLAVVCRGLNAIAGFFFLKSIGLQAIPHGWLTFGAYVGHPFGVIPGLCIVLNCLANVSSLTFCFSTSDYSKELYRALSILKRLTSCNYLSFHLPNYAYPSPSLASSVSTVLEEFLSELASKNVRTLQIEADFHTVPKRSSKALLPAISIERAIVNTPFIHNSPFRDWFISSFNASPIQSLRINYGAHFSSFLIRLSLPSLREFDVTSCGQIATNFDPFRSFLLRHPTLVSLHLGCCKYIATKGTISPLPQGSLPVLQSLTVHPSILPYFFSIPYSSSREGLSSRRGRRVADRDNPISSQFPPHLRHISLLNMTESCYSTYGVTMDASLEVCKTALFSVSACSAITVITISFDDLLNSEHLRAIGRSQSLTLPFIQSASFRFRERAPLDQVKAILIPWFQRTFPNAELFIIKLAIMHWWEQEEKSDFVRKVRDFCPQVKSVGINFQQYKIEDWLAQAEGQ